MVKQFKRNVLAVSAFIVGAFCLLCGVAVLPAAATETTTATATADGYKAVFQDDFESKQLKEGWFDVSGTLSAPTGEWDLSNATSIVWGDGSNTDSGKMLYDVGVTEYMVAADVKFTNGTVVDGDTEKGINMHMPIIVTESGDLNAFTGVSINFRPDYAVLYDLEAGDSIKRSDSTNTRAVIILYEAVPGYNAETWANEFHTWSAIVTADTIEIYVDGYYMAAGARPDYTKNATVCGICGNSISGSAYRTIEYDNFTVWTKDTIVREVNELYDYDIGQLFAADSYEQIYDDYSEYIEYDSDSNTATVKAGAEWENRLISDLDVEDFTLKFTLTQGDGYKYISEQNGILFRASFDTASNKVSGYFFTFYIAKSTGTVNAQIRTLNNVAYSNNGGETSTANSEVLASFGFDKEITLTAKGSTISVTCGTETQTLVDTTYTSGGIGLRTRAVSETGSYKIKFSELKITEYEAANIDYSPDLLFASNGYVQNGSKTYEKYIEYTDSTNTAEIGYGAEFENRLFSNLNVADFSLTFKIASENTNGISSNNAIMFRSYFKDSKIYGYCMSFGFTTAGSTTGIGRIWRMDGKTQAGALATTTDNVVAVGADIPLTLGKAITVEAKGNTFYITTGESTVTRSDNTYASGSVGIIARVQPSTSTKLTTTPYTLTFGDFKIAKEEVAAEDASTVLENLTATDAVSEANYIYSVRKNEEITADDLTGNVIGFVRNGNVYYKHDSTVTATSVLTLGDYEIVGATIRVKDPSGLRFLTTIDEIDYNNFTTYNLTASYGTLMLPTEKLNGKLTLSNSSALDITDERLVPNKESSYSFRAAVTGIKEENYDTYVTARSYITFTLSDGARTVYTKELSRSIRQVSMLALGDETETYDDTTQNALLGYAGVVDTAALTFKKVKTSTTAAVYPRIVELSNGKPYLFANVKYATDSLGSFGGYTSVLKQDVKYTYEGTEYTLTQDNGQPFVLTDGRVIVAYRAYGSSDTTRYSSIRMVIGDKDGKIFGDPIIIAENVATTTDFLGMWEPYIVQNGNELWIYFSCDIATSTVENSVYVSGNATSQSILLAKYDLTTEKVTSTSVVLDGLQASNRYGMSVISKLSDGTYIMVIEGKETSGNFEILASYSKDGAVWSTPVTVFEETDGNCGAPYVAVLPTGQIVISYQSDYDKSTFTVTNSDYVTQSRLKVWVSSAVVTNGMAVADMGLTDVTEKLGLKYEDNQYFIWNSVSVVGTKLYVMGGRGTNTTDGTTTTSKDGGVEVYVAELA